MVGGGQGRKQEEKRKGIIEIPQGVDKSRVALLDDMVKSEFGSVVLLQARGIADFATTQGASDFLRKGLLVTELVEQRLVQQVLDVLGVVEGSVRGGGLGGLLLAPGLTRVNSCRRAVSQYRMTFRSKSEPKRTLENAESTEIGQRDLEFAHGLGTGNVVFGLARGTCETCQHLQLRAGCAAHTLLLDLRHDEVCGRCEQQSQTVLIRRRKISR